MGNESNEKVMIGVCTVWLCLRT